MTSMIPRQRGSCPVFAWCSTEGKHTEHRSDIHTVPVFGDREVAVFITADDVLRVPPTVTIEITFGAGGPRLPVCDLNPMDAAMVADILHRLARLAKDNPAGARLTSPETCEFVIETGKSPDDSSRQARTHCGERALARIRLQDESMPASGDDPGLSLCRAHALVVCTEIAAGLRPGTTVSSVDAAPVVSSESITLNDLEQELLRRDRDGEKT